MTRLSPKLADFRPIRPQEADDDDGSPQEASDISESDVLNVTVDADECSGVDSIENRLRQSNASVLSRYKVRVTADRQTRCMMCRLFHFIVLLNGGCY